MRVKGTLVTLFVMLLVSGMLVPAAGAIYIEGQTIPDDGLMHIMSAEEGAGTSAPEGMPADAGIPAGALPSYVLDGSSFAGLPAGFPVTAMPMQLSELEGMASIPASTVPSDVTEPSIGMIENSISPGSGGIWNFFDTGSLQTDMPLLNGLFF